MNMETPFLYGRIAENENFTNRRNETEFLKKNFKGADKYCYYISSPLGKDVFGA